MTQLSQLAHRAQNCLARRAELLALVRELGGRAERCARRSAERAAEQLQALLRHWPEREALLAPQQQKLDDFAERLPRGLRSRLDRARGALGRAAGALRPGLLAAAHRRASERLAALWRVAQLAHPERPLEKGYALVRDKDGKVLVTAAAAREARLLNLRFRDGDVEAVAGEPVERAKKAPHNTGGQNEAGGNQPKLL
jgi:exodeoxyribonuclease VII large subunit